MQQDNIDDIKKRIEAVINKLPQRELIAEGDARAWIDHVTGVMGEQAVWHAVRAGGLQRVQPVGRRGVQDQRSG